MLDKKSYNKLSGLVFGFVGLMHLLRVFLGWEIVVGPWVIPTWLSLAGGLVLLWLAYNASKLSK